MREPRKRSERRFATPQVLAGKRSQSCRHLRHVADARHCCQWVRMFLTTHVVSDPVSQCWINEDSAAVRICNVEKWDRYRKGSRSRTRDGTSCLGVIPRLLRWFPSLEGSPSKGERDPIRLLPRFLPFFLSRAARGRGRTSEPGGGCECIPAQANRKRAVYIGGTVFGRGPQEVLPAVQECPKD